MSDQFDWFDQFEWSMHSHPWVRHTSKEAWESVLESGWANAKMKQAYSLLYRLGPLTLLELEHHSASEDKRPPLGRSESTVIRRLYDLRDNGLAQITTLIRVCDVSGKRAVTWDVTDAMAGETKKKPNAPCPLCGGSGRVVQQWEHTENNGT